MGEIRLTVAQALVKFLSAQHSESDGEEQRLFAGCFGIFGHGNVAGIGQALLQAELEEPDSLRYILGRNEQAMVHTAVAYARWDVAVSEISTLESTQQAPKT
jgi:3D-(3,5/4)-trihydroxycyclohexane-1,2-dione acylhydrolase (decyclizing)